MRTQVTCPRCQTPHPAEVHQLIDVGQQPELKQYLLSGQLNLSQCPNCGTVFQVPTPLAFHDPAHELFMVHVPVELNLAQAEREQMIGRMVQQVMRSLPAEQKRAYLLTPQMVLTMQTFIEKVLETEGITKEMIERQRQQAELVQRLAGADRDVRDYLVKESAKLIDETFFAILAAAQQSADQSGDEDGALKLINLQASLYQTTPAGKEIYRRQTALRGFQKEVQKAGGLSPELLLKHLLAHINDEKLVESIAAAGQQALSYEFFSLLTAEIEKKEKLGGKTAAEPLVALRQNLLTVYEEMEAASREMMARAGGTLQALLQADNLDRAVAERMEEIDDAFMYVLSANISQAESTKQADLATRLRAVYEAILRQMEAQAPPEVRFVNQLIRTESAEGRRKLLAESPGLVNEGLIRVLEAVMGQAAEADQKRLVDHVADTIKLVEAQLRPVT